MELSIFSLPVYLADALHLEGDSWIYFFHTFVYLIYPLTFGCLLDAILGDPRWLPHPVVWFGKWISFWEKRLNRGSHLMLKGALFTLFSISSMFFIVYFIIYYYLFLCVSPYWGDDLSCLLSTVIVFYCLAFRTLCKEVKAVFVASTKSVEEARKQVSRIVGRDTSGLSVQECRTAALETLAENLSDGVIAPIFWFLIAGAPGMLAYKMINTLDSMIGYRTPRYKEFGCWAARIDDIANFIPARITAVLLILVSSDWHKIRLFRFLHKYARQHLSPNSGWPEAALAGIIGCRFGGPHNYFGEEVYKPYIGDNPRELDMDDLHKSLTVCRRAVLVTYLLFIPLAFTVGIFVVEMNRFICLLSLVIMSASI